MPARIKLIHFILIPPAIVLAANLLGWMSPFIVDLLRPISTFVVQHILSYIFAFLVIIAILLALFKYNLIPTLGADYYVKGVILHVEGGAQQGFIPQFMRDLIMEFHERRFVLWLSIAALVFAILAFIFLFIAIFYQIAAFLLSLSIFKKYNVIFFMIMVFAVFQVILRKEHLESMTWKKLSDLWLKMPIASALSVGGFGFIATADTIKIPLIKSAVESEFTNIDLLISLSLAGLGFMILAWMTDKVGRTLTNDENSNIPKWCFYSTFGLSFISNILMFTSLIDSFFLTMLTHYETRMPVVS